jgi:SHS2 domain-containing protein
VPYRFRDDIAIADVAFEAEGRTLTGLFTNAALAVTNTMVKDVDTVQQKTVKNIALEADDPEMLLYRFLQELVFHKDAGLLLFSGYEIEVSEEKGKFRITGNIRGEELNREKHELVADVKAVSFHNFKVVKTDREWRAEVILDV